MRIQSDSKRCQTYEWKFAHADLLLLIQMTETISSSSLAGGVARVQHLVTTSGLESPLRQ